VEHGERLQHERVLREGRHPALGLGVVVEVKGGLGHVGLHRRQYVRDDHRVGQLPRRRRDLAGGACRESVCVCVCIRLALHKSKKSETSVCGCWAGPGAVRGYIAERDGAEKSVATRMADSKKTDDRPVSIVGAVVVGVVVYTI
jgi:hypothetical protein